MLTPRELRQIEFRRVFRGYDPQEVDEFLARLIEEYEKVFKERQPEPAARPRPAAPPAGGPRPSRESEGAADVREAAELARQAADELRSNAQWEARLILDEARQRAARIEEEARQQAGVERTRLRELREEVDRLLRQLRRLTDEYLQVSSGGPGAGGGTPRSLPQPEVPVPPQEEGETRSFPIAALQSEIPDDDEEEPDRAYRRYGKG